MFYAEMIDASPVTMTAKQLRLAIQEASLAARERALNEAAELAEGLTTEGQRYLPAQLRSMATDAQESALNLQAQIDATNGLIR